MKRRTWLVMSVVLVACSAGETPAPAERAGAPIALWDPIDASFAGCHGACGGHAEGPGAGVVPQPGAAVGQHTYCPVSGAVFEIAATHPHADVEGRTLFFCCAGCASYFEEHREAVLDARGIGRVDVPHAQATTRRAIDG